METKVAFIFCCASAFFIQVINSQCSGRCPNVPLNTWPYDGPFDGYGPGWGATPSATGLPSSYGGGLAVTSTSPIAPTGLAVTSDNAIEGTLNVFGQLPFLGAVATDGAFASVGTGAVTYSCGDGFVGITAETPITPINSGPYGYGPTGYKGVGPYGCGIY